MNELRDLERATQDMVRQMDSANKLLTSLLQAVRNAEKLAQTVDMVDLKESVSLRSSMSQLSLEISQLERSVRTLQSELADTNNKINKARY